MASTVKSLGTGEKLWPDGSNSENVPNDLFVAIEHCTRVLNWQENLFGDEMPPGWMWHLDWEIEAWFEKLKIERERKHNNGVSSSDYNDEGEGMFEENVLFERMKNGEM